MKISAKLSILLSLIGLCSSSTSAQRKTVRPVAHKASTTICKVASVPQGMVVVGYRVNPACGQGMELIVKRPEGYEIVCADSPVPDGYSVSSTQGSAACNTQANTGFGAFRDLLSQGQVQPESMTNAMSISNGAATEVSATGPVKNSRTYSTLQVSNGSPAQSDVVNARAKQLNDEARIANASTAGRIMVGMTMAQVETAMGTRHSADKTVTERGTETEWVYPGKNKSLYVDFGDNDLLIGFRYEQVLRRVN